MSSHKNIVLLIGQTPPPWHGQAVATKILFDHDWPGWQVHRLRMEFSEDMEEVGRFQWKKIVHLWKLIYDARKVLRKNPGSILFYPPASAKWVPFLRDVIFLSAVRRLAGSTVFIYHASGLPVFATGSSFRRFLARRAYHNADVSLEVAQETVSPHETFHARATDWCPCAIDVPDLPRRQKSQDEPCEVLFVGSLQEGKGVLEILRTAEVLKNEGKSGAFHFRIVGKWFSPEFEVATRQLHAGLKLGEMVEFVGQLTGAEKWRTYAGSDIFFFPTHYESEATPIVLMEALGMGLPVVSTRWAGIPEMLEGCEVARLEAVRSPSEFAAALLEIQAQLPRTNEIEKSAKSFYRAHFRPEIFISRVEEAFLKATGQQSPKPLVITAYLADQNPGYDRSFGISRMSQLVLEALQNTGEVEIHAIVSETSQQAPAGVIEDKRLSWNTRRKWVRLFTDHCFPIFIGNITARDLFYFPKGYLPLFSNFCHPSVVTIHDTIIQYDEDRYPGWRTKWEYSYWSWMLRHTLRRAGMILTVSESSKRQIESFMDRHAIPRKEIIVTFEPCVYETIPQPEGPPKDNYVIHLSSCEPHKRSAHLIRWWHEAESSGIELPTLHLIGSIPGDVAPLLSSSRSIVKRPFLTEPALQAAYRDARALILPSEIEGFGLPALEAYYLGTPVCFVRGTSVEEILGVATNKGGFSLDDSHSLATSLAEVMAMSSAEIRECGLKLRETYAAEKIAHRMITAFRRVAAKR
ncbi:MAG: glycosyltransferase [Verrucomicrobiota bacterium]